MESKNKYTIKPIVLVISICLSLITGILIGDNLNENSSEDIFTKKSEPAKININNQYFVSLDIK